MASPSQVSRQTVEGKGCGAREGAGVSGGHSVLQGWEELLFTSEAEGWGEADLVWLGRQPGWPEGRDMYRGLCPAGTALPGPQLETLVKTLSLNPRLFLGF